MNEEQETRWDKLMDKLDEAQQDEPIHAELRKEIIDFLNKTFAKLL